MEATETEQLFSEFKETSLYHRYLTNKHIIPSLDALGKKLHIETIGVSVLNAPIYAVKIGSGPKKILMWSQMHGNESTTTKAVFDVLNTLASGKASVAPIL